MALDMASVACPAAWKRQLTWTTSLELNFSSSDMPRKNHSPSCVMYSAEMTPSGQAGGCGACQAGSGAAGGGAARGGSVKGRNRRRTTPLWTESDVSTAASSVPGSSCSASRLHASSPSSSMCFSRLSLPRSGATASAAEALSDVTDLTSVRLNVPPEEEGDA